MGSWVGFNIGYFSIFETKNDFSNMLHDIFPVHYILKKQKDLGEDYDYAFKSSILNARTRFNLKNCWKG